MYFYPAFIKLMWLKAICEWYYVSREMFDWILVGKTQHNTTQHNTTQHSTAQGKGGRVCSVHIPRCSGKVFVCWDGFLHDFTKKIL